MPTRKPEKASPFEGFILVAIVILVGLAAGAASFTHVHDWTMANSPAGTDDWFGWANAVISELVPVAALLVIRRRKRTGGPIGYPMFLLIAFAGFSLAAQLGVAVNEVGPSGWLLSAVPALAFMALVKLVLAPVKTTEQTDEPADNVHQDDNLPADTEVTDVDNTPTSVPAVDDIPAEPEPVQPEPVAPAPPVITPVPEPVPVPTHLLPTARFAVVQHEQTTGQPITTDELAARMSIPPAVAGSLLAAITQPALNGTPVGGAR